MHENDIHNEAEDREIAELLRDYPAPVADEGFYERALVKATHEGSRRQRNKWLATGFGGAIAAALAVWLVGGMLLGSPDLQETSSPIPEVTIALEEPKTINLVFASATALDNTPARGSQPASGSSAYRRTSTACPLGSTGWMDASSSRPSATSSCR